jgi:hypothetical protein
VNAADVHLDQATIARLHAVSGGAAWGVSREALADALGRSVAHRFDSMPSTSDLETYLSSLHVVDLALACACRAGNDAAWEHLVRSAARALCVRPEPSRATTAASWQIPCTPSYGLPERMDSRDRCSFTSTAGAA